jgi:hypothetical protein
MVLFMSRGMTRVAWITQRMNNRGSGTDCSILAMAWHVMGRDVCVGERERGGFRFKIRAAACKCDKECRLQQRQACQATTSSGMEAKRLTCMLIRPQVRGTWVHGCRHEHPLPMIIRPITWGVPMA